MDPIQAAENLSQDKRYREITPTSDYLTVLLLTDIAKSLRGIKEVLNVQANRK